MKVTFTIKNKRHVYDNVKNIVVYPGGDINTKSFASMCIETPAGKRYENVWIKPDSIRIEMEK